MRLIALLLLSFATFSVPVRADGGALSTEVVGLRDDRGVVRGAVYAAEGDWTVAGREIARCTARIHHGRARCVIPSLPPGTYAVALLHDADEDGRLARDLVGWPQEGFAFSNDVGPSIGGPPSFASASFDHTGAGSTLHVHARYGL